jgi:hypothetical protein
MFGSRTRASKYTTFLTEAGFRVDHRPTVHDPFFALPGSLTGSLRIADNTLTTPRYQVLRLLN